MVCESDFGEFGRICGAQLDDLTVDSQAHEPLSPGLFDHVAKFSDLVGHERRQTA